MKHSVKYFVLDEFKCPCCGCVDVAVALVFWLDVFRRSLNLPLKINSGFRCENHNLSVKGSSSSRHLIGCAADVARPPELGYDAFVGMARRLSGDGWEVVTYPSQTYIHFAVPRACEGKRWNGDRSVEL